MIIIEIIPIGHWNRYLVNKYHVPGTVLDRKDKQIPVPAYWIQSFEQASNVVHYEGIMEVHLGRLPGGGNIQAEF